MKKEERVRFWHGNEAIVMAAQVIDELKGINGSSVEDYFDYNDIEFVKTSSKSSKKTLLHHYIADVYYLQYEYTLDKHFPMAVINSLKELLDFYKVDIEEVGDFSYFGVEDDDLDSDSHEIAENYGWRLLDFFWKKIGELVVDDVFTVLYSNKHFLFQFNSELTRIIGELKYEDFPEFLKKDGVIKRNYLPKWLQRAVFMRDKGRCQVCGTDLTKILNLDNNENYDHIIPLEIGGTNDPVNIQLACESCNKSKGAKNIGFNSLANRYWITDSLTKE